MHQKYICIFRSVTLSVQFLSILQNFKLIYKNGLKVISGDKRQWYLEGMLIQRVDFWQVCCARCWRNDHEYEVLIKITTRCLTVAVQILVNICWIEHVQTLLQGIATHLHRNAILVEYSSYAIYSDKCERRIGAGYDTWVCYRLKTVLRIRPCNS